MKFRIRRSGSYWAVEQGHLLVAVRRTFRSACYLANHWHHLGWRLS